jgi:NAD(P)-dependent dehydrogenase (short-subunit alcohol dehydrogenase family)
MACAGAGAGKTLNDVGTRPMKGKSIVITGASDGIGRALAITLASKGACLTLAARNREGLDRAVQACKDAGGQALAVPTDVTEPAACQALVEQAVKWAGGIDAFVNNAGISFRARLEEVSDLAVFEQVMRVNYLGAVYCTRAALPHLRGRRGLLVAVSSLQGLTGFPGYSGYAASKHAMQGFFDSIRIELRGSGVDVLVVSPGPVATDIGRRGLGPDGSPRMEESRADNSMSVEECARQIARAMARRQRELVMTAQGKLMLWLKMFAPGLVDGVVDKAVRRFLQKHDPNYRG